MRDTKSRLRVLLLLLLLALVAQGGYAEEEEKQLRKPKDKARKPFLEDDGLPDLDQKDERDFVMFLSKCLIVSWLVILALIIGFIFKYKQAKTAQQIAEEAERQKRKNEREKKLLSRSLSRGRSSILKDKKSGEKKGTEDSPIKGGESAEKTAKAEGQTQLQPTDGDGRSEEKYLKKIADLEKRAKEEKEKREVLEQQLKVEAHSWEERLDTAFKDKCMEEGKCVELKKRVDEEKARNEELEKRNVEYAVLLEGERRKYAELNKQFEDLNSHLMQMLTSVDKKRQEKKKNMKDPIDDEEL